MPVVEQKRVPLTPNQMILLLQIYRGLINEKYILTEDTFVRDMRYLLKNDLVSYDGQHFVTVKGTSRVMDVLE